MLDAWLLKSGVREFEASSLEFELWCSRFEVARIETYYNMRHDFAHANFLAEIIPVFLMGRNG